ncbi:probable methyltransferase PMT16 [Chenopodium quinoa]|uniref:probable methyltransferase PMT16 n=1 Tax=Chenopodium quinoa TaxID=63459 RepID=UPI000B792565|nr:probable methyltransferase PMT16 [Chenopodium quinoa]XP_021730132.1 probable methyltransferase PMT16 [Chenopodium quinoa]
MRGLDTTYKIFPFWRKINHIYALTIVTILCSSYLLGRWQRGSGEPSTPAAIVTCTTNNLTTPTQVPKLLDFSAHHVAENDPSMSKGSGLLQTRTYPSCNTNYIEYTPCEDPKRSLKLNRTRLMHLERHCPAKTELLKCRIPAPYGYKKPFTWPVSRDYAWYNNVPHKELTVKKAGQNWIRFEGDRFKFPGGGTMFRNGANAYIDDIAKLVNLQDGAIRTAIDTGCGVASWGSYLLSRNILTMSFAPRDTHEAQVQFALERGVPALIGVMASKRLPYPSRAYDMAHCSRCLIPWDQYDGVYLIEVDRVLRPGGYWILSGPPIRWKRSWKSWERSKEDLNAEQSRIENLAKNLCWKKVIEKDDIAIWQKPINHFNCRRTQTDNPNPPLCPTQDPDLAWYTDLQTCLTPLPEVSANQEVGGGQLAKWPKRLTAIPPRINSGSVNGVTPEMFQEDIKLWKRRMLYYKKVNYQLGQPGRYRNLLDMNAYFGGFAAALVDDPVWVMNVVPVEAKVNTLGVIYERGLIGTYQSWCEAMSTYPRTYDFIHADSIFTLYKDRCEMEDILLEMDRILRPKGSVIIRDDVDVLVKIKKITDALEWDSQVVNHEDGPLKREKLLFGIKTYWTTPNPTQQEPNTHS